MTGRTLSLLGLLFFGAFVRIMLFAQSAAPVDVRGKHLGAINSILVDPSGRILSAGDDGYLNIWDEVSSSAVDRFQLSPLKLSAMSLHPAKTRIAIAESDGALLNRISVWDYLLKRCFFTVDFREAVNFLTFSGNGNFIIAARGGSGGVVFIHPENGEILPSPAGVSGGLVFAATGKSEKTMVSYVSSGILSYWDLDSREEIRRLEVPRNIKSPLLIGNNRFLAGFDNTGLLALEAVSGRLIFRDTGVKDGILAAGNPEMPEFLCVYESGGKTSLRHYNIPNSGKPETRLTRTAPSYLGQIKAAAVISLNAAVLGTEDGQAVIFNRGGQVKTMASRNQIRIKRGAVSSGVLAFFTEDSRLGFVPLDYNSINSNTSIKLSPAAPYTELSPFFARDFSGRDAAFLMWQKENTYSLPLVKTLKGAPESGETADTMAGKLSFRYPLKAASSFGGLLLFLDSAGNITVIDHMTGAVLFTFSAPSAQDAGFADRENIIIARNSAINNSPFLLVNIMTGETVPYVLNADIGAKVYRSPAGNIYGGIIRREGLRFKSAIVSIGSSNNAQPPFLAEYSGETSGFEIAESQGWLFSSMGGENAVISRIHGPPDKKALERSSGLPGLIMDGGSRIVVIDNEGSICWYAPYTGQILALLRIYREGWILEKGAVTIRGISGNAD
jgi:WD40 repeat protein